jgi:N-acetyl sugar amidotransferase
VKWCKVCVLPDTRPNLFLDASGVCNACRNHSTKREIDWIARRKQLELIVQDAKARANGYDCVIPVSGGKDSTWQTVKCLELGLKPLAVTWRPPGRTEIGLRNLDNLRRLGVDHIDYSIDRSIEVRFMLKAFQRLGSTAVPMHLALFNIPLSIAVRFRVPLVVWGENSAFEYGNKTDADTGFELNSEWLKTYGVTHGTTAADWADEELTTKDLTPYCGPRDIELNAAGVRAIFLGYYMPWDPELTRGVASSHGFEVNKKGPRTGYYNYADIDDDFISLHHWMKWYKFGFTRTFDNLSIEIRNGRISREAALAIIQEHGLKTPVDDIKKFCSFSGIDLENFLAIAEKFRNHDIWKKSSGGVWYLPEFLISNWKWRVNEAYS